MASRKQARRYISPASAIGSSTEIWRVNIPVALIGDILALVIGQFSMSASASVGFIALFCLAVLNGVVMVSYFNELRREEIQEPFAVYVDN